MTGAVASEPRLAPVIDATERPGHLRSIRRSRVVRRLFSIALALGVIIGAWAAIIALFDIQPWVMPEPIPTIETLVTERAEIWDHTRVTIIGTVAGLAFSTAFAIALAGLFVTSPTTERLLLPLAIVLRSIPIVAVAPLITLFAGRGLRTSIICVTIVSFFPVLVNTAKGFRAMSPEMRELMRVTGASRLQLFRYARFPTALPYLFAGLRSAAAVAVLGALLAEWLTGVNGLGNLLTLSAALRDTELLWSVVIVATLLSLVLFWLMQALERAVLAWSTGVR